MGFRGTVAMVTSRDMSGKRRSGRIRRSSRGSGAEFNQTLERLEEPVIASKAKQSITYNTLKYLDCFVAIAPRNDRVQKVL